ncbi:MAG: glycosyltransferase [Chloroflexi bacterium]|nr:glycosyltransferase [Chloroflexota bacterium]
MNVYVREVSRQLGKNGMTVDVFTRWSDPTIPQIVQFDDHARVIHLKAGPVKPVHKSQIFQHLPEFICNLRRFKEDEDLRYRLLHSHYWLSGWVAGLLRQRWSVPHVAMFHTLGGMKNRARPEEKESVQRVDIERKIIASADALVASSHDEKAGMISLYGANPRKIKVIPCGVDLTLFRPMERRQAKQSLGLDGKRILLFVGRIEPLKGLDLLFETLASLRSTFGDLRLLVLGEEARLDGELHRLKRYARQLQVEGSVTFTGIVDRERLPVYYNAADICVVPSHYESFSLVAAEALACGTPVVASQVGGLQSLIVDHENGLLVPSHSPQAFSATIRVLLQDDELRGHLSRTARRSVQEIGWSAIAKEVLVVYDELADARTCSDLCLCGRW